jgi:hypothetical protein
VSPVRYELGFYIPEDVILHSHRRDPPKCYSDWAKCQLFDDGAGLAEALCIPYYEVSIAKEFDVKLTCLTTHWHKHLILMSRHNVRMCIHVCK